METEIGIWPKETVYDENSVRIDLEDYKLKFYKDDKLITESKKKYYGDVKVVFDPKREKYYVLDTENSRVDIYLAEDFDYSAYYGKKIYWMDFLREVKRSYFLNSQSSDLISMLKLYYPNDMTLKGDDIFIWDTENHRIIKYNIEKMKETAHFFLNKQIKNVCFKRDFIFILDGNVEKIDYDSNEFQKIPQDEIDLWVLYNDYQISEFETIVSEIEKANASFLDREKYVNSFSDLLFFNKIHTLEVSLFDKVSMNCTKILYNEIDKEFMMIENLKEKNRYKVLIKEESGKQIAINGIDKTLGKIADICLYNGSYLIIEQGIGKNKIIEITKDKEIKQHNILEEYYEENFHRIVKSSDFLAVVSSNSGNVFQINDLFSSVIDKGKLEKKNNNFIKWAWYNEDSLDYIERPAKILVPETSKFIPEKYIMYDIRKPIVKNEFIYFYDSVTNLFLILNTADGNNKKITFIPPVVDEMFELDDSIGFYSRKTGNIYKIKNNE